MHLEIKLWYRDQGTGLEEGGASSTPVLGVGGCGWDSLSTDFLICKTGVITKVCEVGFCENRSDSANLNDHLLGARPCGEGKDGASFVRSSSLESSISPVNKTQADNIDREKDRKH